MGIANTTASAALICAFTGADPAEVTGRGTGIDAATYARKIDVVCRGLARHQPDPADPVGVLAAFGGFEHAALAGFILGAAALRVPVILDGVIAGAAALAAAALAPDATAACFAGHRSAEPGHAVTLSYLGLRPLVDLGLRLGEGTGALLALPLVQSAARALRDVATFDSAGVAEKKLDRRNHGPVPAGLRLDGRRVVVVGGGAVASRRIPALLDAGADVQLVSPKVTASLEDLAAAGRIRWEPRGYRPGDCAGAWLVCACTDDPAVNAAVAAAAEAQRTWCVRADDAGASAAWTPGLGPGRRRPGGCQCSSGRPAAQRRDQGRDRRPACVRPLSARHGRGHRAGVAIIGGGPGDPGLITVRGRQLLAEADVVVTDRLAPRSLLDELRDDVEIIDAGKIPYGRAMAQEHINAALIGHAQAGRFVVRLKGGDPFVFGRGAEEVLACLRAGVPVTVVPGVTSAVGVPASAGVPVTHRGIAQEFHVVSAHVPPGDERSTVNWELLGGSSGTLVLLMAVERIGAVADALLRYGRSPDTPVSVIADGTLPTQRTINSTLEQVESWNGGGDPSARHRRGRRRSERRGGDHGTHARCRPPDERDKLRVPRRSSWWIPAPPRDPKKPLTCPPGLRGGFERTLQRWKVRAWQRHRRLPSADRASTARPRPM